MLTIPFAGNKMQKLFPARLTYRHCCASITMRPSGLLYWSSEQFDFETLQYTRSFYCTVVIT